MSYPDNNAEIPEGGFAPALTPKGYPMMQGQEQPGQGYPIPQGPPMGPGQPYQHYPIPQGQMNVAYQPLAQNPVIIQPVNLSGRGGLMHFVGKYAKYLIACRCGLVLGIMGVMTLISVISTATLMSNHESETGSILYIFSILPVICLITSIVLCCYVKKGYAKYKVESEEEKKKQDEIQRAQMEQQKEMTDYYRNQNQMFQQQQQQQYHQQQHQQYHQQHQQQQQFQNLGTA